MRLLDRLIPEPSTGAGLERASSLSFQQFVDWFTFQSHQYGLVGSQPSNVASDFPGYIEGVHRRSPVVSAAAVSRALLISQVRFVWRNNYLSATPGRQYGSAALAPLEQPGSGTRTNFLASLEFDVSYAGNAYVVVRNGKLFRLRPDWVTIVLTSDDGPTAGLPPSDASVKGIIYQPTVDGRKGRPELFMAGEFAHWMPEPDPLHSWRGASWVSSLMSEITLDGQVSDHQSKYFARAATPNMVFIMDPGVTPTQVAEYAKLVNEKHSGPGNSHKNMFLGGGTDVKVVGSSLDSLGLKDLAGGVESRVAARSMVPAVVLGIREGMQGSSLNSGNYGQTRRLWADKWFTPTVDGLCEALSTIVRPAADSELSWDRSRVMFLQEDEKDAADIVQIKAGSIRNLVDGGFDPKSVQDAVDSGDLSKLVHTGNVSVQLQPPGTGKSEGATPK